MYWKTATYKKYKNPYFFVLILRFVKNMLTMFISLPFIFNDIFESLLVPSYTKIFNIIFIKKALKNVSFYRTNFTRKQK